jgi:HSP20 family protein
MAEIKPIMKKDEPTPLAKPGESSWPSIQSLRHEIDEVFEQFSRGLPHLWRMGERTPLARFSTLFGASTPAVDLVEKDMAYEITAELPGLEPSAVQINVSGNMLILKGEKKEEREEKNRNYHLSERRFGSFQRSFQLPDGADKDRIEARFEKGVLYVMIPKTAKAREQEKIIPIKAA